MLAGSHRNAWPDETGTGGRTNRNTQSMSADNIPVGQAANIYLPVYTSDNNVNYTVFFINAFSQIIENSETYSIWGGYSSDGEVNSNQLIDVSIGNSEYLQ